MKSLSQDERKLLIIQGLDILAYSLASIFVTVFFFANSDLKTTVLYRAISFASMAFFMGAAGWTLRKFSSGLHMKVALFSGAFYYFLLFLLRQESVHYIIPLAILDGFTGGWYWAGFNLNQYILSHSGRRVEYFGWALALVNLAQAVGPAVGGLIIAFAGASALGVMGGYGTLFLLVSIIIAGITLLIGKLPTHELPAFRYRHLLEHKRSREWKLVLGQQGVNGLYDVASNTVIGVLLYTIIHEEAKLGVTLAVASVIGMISSLGAIRLLTRFGWSYWIGAVGLGLSLILFALFQNWSGVVLFLILSALTVPLLQTRMSTTFYEALDHAPGTWQDKYHFLLERDVVLAVLRMVSYIDLYGILLFGNEITLARSWLLILPIVPLFIAFLLHKSSVLASQGLALRS